MVVCTASMQGAVVMRAVALGNDHAGAGGEARRKTHQHIDDAGGAAYRGQRLRADKLTHDDGIHRIIELLEQQPDGHGNRETYQLTPDRALRHVGVAPMKRPGRTKPSLVHFL